MRRVVITILVAGIFVLLCAQVFRSREPAYQGRSLSAWIDQLEAGDPVRVLPWEPWKVERSAEQTRAAEAIRQIGTNGLPFLLRSLRQKDSALKLRLIGFVNRLSRLTLSSTPDYYIRWEAALAFDALGPIARPALSELARDLDDPEISREAATALAAIGPEGWLVLKRRVHATNSWVSASAVWALASHHIEVPREMMESFMSEVTNTAPGGNGGIEAWALGEMGQSPEQVIPVLVKGLQSSDGGVRWGSAIGLGRLGSNAVSAIPGLLKSMEDTDIITRMHATNAFKQIDPEAARARAE